MFIGFIWSVSYHWFWWAHCAFWTYCTSPCLSPLLPPAGWPNSACGPEVSSGYWHDPVHHWAHGRRRSHPAVSVQFTRSRSGRDHRSLSEPALHREQHSPHVPSSHLLGQTGVMLEEMQMRKNSFLWFLFEVKLFMSWSRAQFLIAVIKKMFGSLLLCFLLVSCPSWTFQLCLPFSRPAERIFLL